jgi:hypothetical protein
MKVQLVVWHRGESSPRYFKVPKGQGWRVDTAHRQLVVGVGLPRTIIPLDNVLWYEVEEYGACDHQR